MVELKDLFAKYDKFLFSEENKRQAIIKTIEELIGVTLKVDDVTIKNGTVFINIKPIYKNEILIKKERILKNLEGSFTKKTPTDIR